MRLILAIVLALLAATPATARMWVDAECMNILVRYEAGFLFIDQDTIVTCEISDWPIDTPTAEIQCSREMKTTLTLLGNGVIVLGGLEMTKYDGPIPCGDGGAEWPD